MAQKTEKELKDALERARDNIKFLKKKLKRDNLQKHIKAGYLDTLGSNLDMEETLISLLKRKGVSVK